MRVTWRTEWPHWVLLTLLVLILALAPVDMVAIHWNLAGRADGFANKWLVLTMVGGLYLLLLGLPRLDPGRANYAQFAGAYAVIRFAVLAVLVVLVGSAAVGARSKELPQIVIGALLLVIGSVLGKIRPNWFVGIRTPWTLASKRAWLKTHRLGGWLFMAWGLVEILAGLLLPTGRGVTVTVVGAGVVVAILVVYSYLVWRSDPDKLPAVGTSPADAG